VLNQKQLVWRCRRGVRELDVLLTQFLASSSGYAELGQRGRADFERLLAVQDPVIMDWLFGKYAPEDEGLEAIIERLKTHSGL